MIDAQSAIAQIDHSTGEIDTYQTLLERSICTAKAIIAQNVLPGDVVVIHSHNHINTIVPVIASYFVGVIPTILDYTLPVNNITELLTLIMPKIIYSNSCAVHKMRSAVEKLGVQTKIVNFEEFHNFISKFTPDDFTPINTEDMDETAAIFFTSGTTGFPKKVSLSHKMLLSSVLHLQHFSFSVRFTTVAQNSFWISTTSMFLNVVFNQSCRILVPNIESCNLWETITKHEVSVLTLVPSLLHKLFENSIPSPNSLLLLLISGGTPSLKQMLKLRANLPDTLILPIYGQTELGGVSISFNFSKPNDLKLAYERPTSCGRPHMSYSYKVVNPDTQQILGPNQIGEICIKTECVPKSLLRLSDWDEDGFYKTGDLGYYDNEFCFYVTDRIKEIFKYKTTKIVPSKLETILKTHPDVKDAVVIGFPNLRDGNHPMALVVPNCCGASAIDIINYLNAKVRNEEQLRGGVMFVKKIHTTSLGKVKRIEMRNFVIQSRL